MALEGLGKRMRFRFVLGFEVACVPRAQPFLEAFISLALECVGKRMRFRFVLEVDVAHVPLGLRLASAPVFFALAGP